MKSDVKNVIIAGCGTKPSTWRAWRKSAIGINAEALEWQDQMESIDDGKYADLIAVS
jgi:hypothetical protein